MALTKPGSALRLTVGDVVEDHVEVITNSNHNYVAVVVPLAAGLEPLNPKLATAPPEATPSGSLTATNGFGDIAINTTTGILYAATSTGLFYSVDLNNPLTASYNQIASGNPSLQLAFNEDYSLLYGQSYSTGEWYLVNMANGTAVDTGFNFQVPGTSAGFRDLAGSSINALPFIVPEPSTLVLAGMGAAGLACRLARRRSRRGAAGLNG
jgi:hypothetical protein